MYRNCGILGYPLEQSILPLIYANFFSRTKINGGFTAFDVKEEDELPIVLHFLERFNFSGLNIASPHKISILKHVQDIHSSVKEIGAADLLNMTSNGWVAYNAQGDGFLNQFKNAGVLPNENILIIGAGGTARAALWALKKIGLKSVSIANRSESRVSALEEFFPDIKVTYLHYDNLRKEYFFDTIINAAPIDWSNRIWLGRFWPPECNMLGGNEPSKVFDIHCGLSCGTPFLSMWNKADRYDGADLVLEQAKVSFNIWFDKEFDCNINDIV